MTDGICGEDSSGYHEENGDREYFFSGGGLLAAAMILQVLARNVSGMATWYAHHVSSGISESNRRFFWLFPFSVVEKALYFSCFGVILYAYRFWREPRRVSGENGIFD